MDDTALVAASPRRSRDRYRRDLPVHAAQGHMPWSMPVATGFHPDARFCWRSAGSRPGGYVTWSLLPRLLLGADGGARGPRADEHRVDGAVRRHLLHREERPFWRGRAQARWRCMHHRRPGDRGLNSSPRMRSKIDLAADDISNMSQWEENQADWKQTSEGPIDSGTTFQQAAIQADLNAITVAQ